MKRPLCVLLPVYNAQHCLAGAIARILDVLPEWSDRFELALVDDGSEDDTADVAIEAAARFPQVRLLRHPIHLGLAEAIQTGLDQAGAKAILIGNDAYQFDVEDLRMLWRLRDTLDEAPTAPGSFAALPASQSPAVARPSLQRLAGELGFQLIHREVFDELRLAQAADTIARIDVESRSGPTTSSPQPNFLERLKRFTASE